MELRASGRNQTGRGELVAGREDLLAPEALRQLLWQPPSRTVESVSQMLASLNARVWQQELVAPLVVELLS